MSAAGQRNAHRRRARWTAAAWALAGVLGGTGQPLAAVEVIDDDGRRVTLARPASRIVSLTPHLTELLFEAGAGAQVVGVAMHSDFPPEASTLPRIGDARALDIERILALQPDLVVAWRSGNPLRQLGQLRTLGLAVFMNEPGQLDDIAGTIARLGVLAGTQAVAAQRARRFRERLADIRAAHAAHAPIHVFYQIWDKPLLTVSGKHVIDDALRSCGARNIFAELDALVPRPSREAVLLADPAVIVAADGSGAARARLQSWLRWQQLQAVRYGNLYTLAPDLMHRHSPRILDGVETLCAQIEAARSKLGGAR